MGLCLFIKDKGYIFLELYLEGDVRKDENYNSLKNNSS